MRRIQRFQWNKTVLGAQTHDRRFEHVFVIC